MNDELTYDNLISWGAPELSPGLHYNVKIKKTRVDVYIIKQWRVRVGGYPFKRTQKLGHGYHYTSILGERGAVVSACRGAYRQAENKADTRINNSVRLSKRVGPGK